MVKDKYFYYQANVNTFGPNVFCVEIGSINSKEELYNIYNKHFMFPYFGYNWDALKDSLCGLDEWIKEKKIVIIHNDLPHLGKSDLENYIAILYYTCELWEKYPDVLSFQVFFPEKDKSIIRKHLEKIR